MNLQIQKNNSKLDWINLESDEASLQVPLSFLDNFFFVGIFIFITHSRPMYSGNLSILHRTANKLLINNCMSIPSVLQIYTLHYIILQFKCNDLKHV